MKILVSGGAGFIGSHLIERLLLQGHDVTCMDNFLTGSRKNLMPFLKHDSFRLIEQDITEPFMQDLSQTEQIFHLACPASPIDYYQVPLQTAWTSAAGTKNLLELASKYDIPLLYASSSEVYGDPAAHPQTEDYWGNVNPIGERACYNEGKRFAEMLCMNFWRQFQFPLKITRIFNTYGPRMRKHDGRVIPEFIQRGLAGEPLPVHGDGNQTRSFCYIDDLVDGLIALMNTEKSFTGPVNLGNPEEITMNDLAKKILDLLSSKSVVRHDESLQDDPLKRCPDISLSKKIFGFQPRISLEEGLKKTIEYFRSNA